MMLVLQTLLLALLVQEPPSVHGVVLKSGTNEPVIRASVELRRSDGGDARTYGVTTLKDGRFEFHSIPSGQYQLSVSRAGYVKFTYGERRPGGTGVPIILPGAAPPNLQLVMTPTGVVSGRILDRAGQPLANATVQAMKVSYVQGTKRLSEVQSTLTDDLGEYRLFWLTPGQYYIGALPTIGPRRSVGSGGPGTDSLREFRIQAETTTARSRVTEEVATMVYFPGTLDDQSATPIAVKAGEEVRRVDFLVAPVRTRHIRGVVVSKEPGQPLTGSVSLRLATGSGFRLTSSPTPTFDLSALIPGKYIVSAEINGMFGSVPVEVRDQDVDNVVVPVSRGFSLSGRIVVEGATQSNPGPDIKSLRLSFRSDPETGLIPNPATAGADGAFTIQPLYPGNYRVTVTPALQNAYVKSMRHEEREVLISGVRIDGLPTSPLIVVISANPGTVIGRVTNEKQEPIPNAVVVLVPERDLRTRPQLFANVTSDGTGQFRIQSITPGSYKLFAWEDVENGAWFNADFMNAQEERGTSIEIREGDTKSIPLTTILNP